MVLDMSHPPKIFYITNGKSTCKTRQMVNV